MKIIVTGCRGQLGTEIIKQLREARARSAPSPKSCSTPPSSRWTCPSWTSPTTRRWMTSSAATSPTSSSTAPPTPTWTAARQTTTPLQGQRPGPPQLAQAAEKMGARLVHVSTDYVFSGRENGGVPQDEACLPGPISAYGSTKLMGEKYVQRFCHRHFIVRTAWLYSYYGKNFVKTIAGAGKKYGRLEVVNDQLATPPRGGPGPRDFAAVRHPRVRPVPLHRRGHLLLVRLCLRDHPAGRGGRHGRALHQRRVQGQAPRQRRPPPLERSGQPRPALLDRQPGPPLAGGAGLLFPPLGRGQRYDLTPRAGRPAPGGGRA